MTHTLILLRHGESEWNAKNLFTGWVDVPLSELGESEAGKAGTLLTERGFLPDVVHRYCVALFTRPSLPLMSAIVTGFLSADHGD
jgi:bisphosphoglycerate-dependent phosphoglycerate mutase